MTDPGIQAERFYEIMSGLEADREMGLEPDELDYRRAWTASDELCRSLGFAGVNMDRLNALLFWGYDAWRLGRALE